MKKNIFVTLILVVSLMLIGGLNVYGNGGSSGDPAPGDGDNGSCKQCSCAYQPGSYVYGVRISLVYWDTGNRVSNTKSIDVFESSTLMGLAANKPAVYTLVNDNNAKYNRVDMIVGNKMTETNPKLEKTTWSQIDKVFVSQLGWTSDKISFNYGDSSAEILYSKMNVDLYNVLQSEVDAYAASGYEDKTILSVTTALFSALGTDFTKYTKKDLENMHLIVEPLIGVAVKGVSNMEASYNLFYGTITEIGAAFPQYNCVSENSSGWSMSASLVNRFGIGLYGTRPCNTNGDPKYCVLNGWDVGDPNSSDYSIRLNLLRKKNANGMGLIWLGSLNMPKKDTCASAIEYINNLYTSHKISQNEYDTLVLQVKNGTFNKKDEATGVQYIIDTPQKFDFLIKTNYDKFNGGLAACTDREKASLNCDDALNYINSNYQGQAYHDAVDQVEAGTFSYEMYDGTTVTIDKSYSYNMLDKSVYVNQGGKAQCKDIPIICDNYKGANINIDDCDTGISYFKDIEDENAWLVCEIAYTKDSKIYSSDNTGHDAVETTNGGIVGNSEYCEVYCYEEIETLFPTHVNDVKAGQTFTWGDTTGTFGTIKIRKKCSTQNYVKGQQGYRFEEWEEDYKNNEKSMIEHYMKKASYEKMKNKITTSSERYYSECCDCCIEITTDASGNPIKPYESCEPNCEPRWKGTASVSGASHSSNHNYLGGNITGSVTVESLSVEGYESSADAEAAAKEAMLNKLTGLASDEERKYSQNKNMETTLIEKIEQCTNNIEYAYKATVQFVFKEPINAVYGANSRSFEYNGNLEVDGSYNEDNVDRSKCSPKTIYKYTCSGTGASAACSEQSQQVWDCSVVTWNIEGSYTYKYPTEYFQWYSLKTNSTLVNESERGTEDDAFFYSIGFGLPTAFSLTDGTYELKAVVYDLGDKADFSGGAPFYERPEDTHFDPLGLNVNTTIGAKKGFEYICTYEVENDIFGYDCQYEENGKRSSGSPEYCDEFKNDDSKGSLIGIDITYRLVTLLSDGDSLEKAFPGKEGYGREPGINWQLGEEELMKILNSGVYNEPAMYEIMLDVNAIQVIRDDNQSYFDAGKDPYASYYDADNNQKVYCATNGNEKYCASDFISNLYAGSGLNYRLLGTCLPTGNTLERAEHILEKGCNTTYTYPTINWEK